MEVSEAKRLKAREEESAKLKKLLAKQMLDAAALCELLSKSGRARCQALCGRASTGRHEPVGTAGLLDHGRESEVDPLSLQPPCIHGSARTGGRSATAGCSSCSGGRVSHRGSTGSTGFIARKGSPESRGDPCPILIEARSQRALVAGLRP